VVCPLLPPAPPFPTSPFFPTPNQTFLLTSSTSYPLTPQFPTHSPLPIGPSQHNFIFPKNQPSPPIGQSDTFCPLFFSALFSASDTQYPNPFQSINIEPFPIDPTHHPLFPSPFDLTLPLNDSHSPTPPHPPPPAFWGRGVWGGRPTRPSLSCRALSRFSASPSPLSLSRR
jgi:hypothetical protein